MDTFTLLKLRLENERSVKAKSLPRYENPVEQELMERELELLEAQIGWIMKIQENSPSLQI